MRIKCDTMHKVGLKGLTYLYKCCLFLEYLVKPVKPEISTDVHLGQVCFTGGPYATSADKLVPTVVPTGQSP